MKTLDCEYLIIGSGLAGMVAALKLCQAGRVILATKCGLSDSNSDWAQGGIACVMHPEDSPEDHIRDTLETGCGICDEAAVRAIIAQSRTAIAALEQAGVPFEQTASGGYDLGREAGHSARRILHAGDITGREIVKVLADRVRAQPRIEVRTHAMAIDLVTTGWMGRSEANRCIGSYFFDRQTRTVFAVRSPHTVLATGGAGKVYTYTSNPDLATGDGIAMAWRAGVPIKNMEFVQFHPTCLYHSQAKSFLISEAVRGEGAKLINAGGEAFMPRYTPRGELAPRDIVARAIDQEMKTRGDPCVYLDITHRPSDFLQTRFPNIYATCLRLGIDLTKDPIPVVPAAHYLCGGVEARIDGTTALPGLYACGEVACTGMHGANRLASNSLLEALVGGIATAQQLLQQTPSTHPPLEIPAWHAGSAVPSDEAVVVEHNWNEVRTCMWDYVGIVRTNKRLERAMRRIRNLRREIRQYYLDYLVTPDVLELRNIAAVAELIVRCATLRHESRGLHYTLDYPDRAEPALQRDTRIQDPPGDSITPDMCSDG